MKKYDTTLHSLAAQTTRRQQKIAKRKARREKRIVSRETLFRLLQQQREISAMLGAFHESE